MIVAGIIGIEDEKGVIAFLTGEPGSVDSAFDIEKQP